MVANGSVLHGLKRKLAFRQCCESYGGGHAEDTASDKGSSKKHV